MSGSEAENKELLDRVLQTLKIKQDELDQGNILEDDDLILQVFQALQYLEKNDPRDRIIWLQILKALKALDTDDLKDNDELQQRVLKVLQYLDPDDLQNDEDLQPKILEVLYVLKVLNPNSLKVLDRYRLDILDPHNLAGLKVPKFVLILDAGSSGTRAYGFKYEEWRVGGKKGPTPPKIEELFKVDQAPGAKGITTCAVADGTEDAASVRTERVKSYLTPILTSAKAKFGRSVGNFKDIRLFILATAGMRDLRSARPAEFALLETAIHVFLKTNYLGTDVDNERFDADTANSNRIYKTISGEEEAAHGWIAANFSLGTLSELGQLSTEKLGYLEMGGASAQIAFKPFDNELAPEHLDNGDITRVTMGGKTLDLFLKTYPLGADKAWEEYQKDLINENDKGAVVQVKGLPTEWEQQRVALIAAAAGNEETAWTTYIGAVGAIKDPNSPKGRKWTYKTSTGPDRYRPFEGTGKFNLPQFHSKVDSVLDRLGSPQNPGGSHLLNSHLIKSLKARSFVGGANFYYSTRLVFGRDIHGNSKQGMFSFEEYIQEIQRTTALDWKHLVARMNTEVKYMNKAWFVAEWVQCALVEGFGFTLHDGEGRTANNLSFRPYNGPKGAELSWTLGKIVLLASGGNVDDPAHIDEITAYHNEHLAKRMREKAVYWEEMLWDYLFMIESLTGTDHIAVQRKEALKVLAKHAAGTSWKLKWAAQDTSMAGVIKQTSNYVARADRADRAAAVIAVAGILNNLPATGHTIITTLTGALTTANDTERQEIVDAGGDAGAKKRAVDKAKATRKEKYADAAKAIKEACGDANGSLEWYN